ncbi:choice-of-anchor Q domain-containing protein [Haliangium ochraceum]|nr:choice-of-anchor Q domain-containing protein [Haliangium ochraceum]
MSCSAVYLYSGTHDSAGVQLDRDIEIHGVGAGPAMLDGNGADRVLDIRAEYVTLSSLVIKNGYAEQGAGVYFEGGELLLEDVQIRDNRAEGAQAAGAGLFSAAGTVRMLRSEIRDNLVKAEELGRGGGVYAEGGEIFLSEGSTIEDNQVRLTGAGSAVEGWGGGAFLAASTMWLDGDSSLSRNLVRVDGNGPLLAARGGGIALASSALEIAAGGSLIGNRVYVEGMGDLRAEGGGAFLAVPDESDWHEGPSALHMSGAMALDNAAEARAAAPDVNTAANARGGAIFANSRHASELNLRIDAASEISDNRAEASAATPATSTAQGGALYAMGDTCPGTDVVIADSSMTGNMAIADTLAQGGAWFAGTMAYSSSVNFRFLRSTASDNRAQALYGTAEGGAAHIAADASAQQEGLMRGQSRNLSDDDASLSVEITNSTLSTNQSISLSQTHTSRGGGLSITRVGNNIDLDVSLNNATLASNSAMSSGGALDLSAVDPPGNPQVTVRNSLFAYNSAPVGASCATEATHAKLRSAGYNLLDDASACEIIGAGAPLDHLDVEPGVAPLAANGGPTATHALLWFSPALDGGNPEGCMNAAGEPIDGDQCGQPRGDRCDIGAFEH